MLAHQAARRAIKREFQAQGVRLHDLTAREIAIWGEAWFNAHSAELIAEAKHTIATWPEFARWREPRRPVSPSDNSKTPTEKTQVFSTTSAIFSGARLLIAD
jgi:hypothetical protein